MCSCGTTSNQHSSADLDDLRHIDSAPCPLTLSSSELPIVPPAPDPPEPEVMTDMPTRRINRPRRDELSTRQTFSGRPETPESIAHEDATTSCIGQADDRDAQLQQMVLVTLLLFLFEYSIMFANLFKLLYSLQESSEALKLSDDRQRIILRCSHLISENQMLDGHFVAEAKQVDNEYSASVPTSPPKEPATDIPDAAPPEINERMTSVPSPRYNRPRRIEVNADQNGGALEALEMHHFADLETATSAFNIAQETLLIDRFPPREGVFLSCLS